MVVTVKSSEIENDKLPKKKNKAKVLLKSVWTEEGIEVPSKMQRVEQLKRRDEWAEIREIVKNSVTKKEIKLKEWSLGKKK